MTRFSATALDLSRVDRKALWPGRSFQDILDERLVDLKGRYAEINLPWNVERLQTDSGVRLQRTGAYREELTGQAIDDAQASVLLAYAGGAFLDRLGDQHGTARLPGESDERYRARIQIAPEAFASAGTLGGYLFWATSVDTGAEEPEVRDVAVTVINPGTADVGVEVTILSTQGDGTPSVDLMNAVRATLFRDDVKPLTTALTVRPAKILPYDYAATLYHRPGPDPQLLKTQAEAAVRAVADTYKRVGGDVPMNALDAKAYVGGVERIVPAPGQPATIETLRFQAAHLGAVTITTEELRD